MPELRALGQVTQFKVCCNQSPHLRGNVYVSYSTEREALRAYYALSGRFYGGRQIQAQFCTVPEWSKAVCGKFYGSLFHKTTETQVKYFKMIHQIIMPILILN